MAQLRFERGFTLADALEMIYDDADPANIFIEPPDAALLTDEDSGDEDNGGTVDNLPGSQLRALTEVKLSNDTRIGNFDVESEVEDVEPVASTSGTQQSASKKIQSRDNPIEWIYGDLETNHRSFPAPNYSRFEGLSPVDLFELFFDDEVISFLVRQSSQYALFKNEADPKISMQKFKCFLGILILSGYNTLPGKRFYWDSEDEMKNLLVYNSMRRDRFLQINKFVHCADNNNPDLTDKIWKMRPLFDKIKQRFLENFVPEEHICYDESMIKYYGRHSCKQFIRGKPIRFGYKMWCLNSTGGYLINFELYQGNNPRRSLEYEKMFGKASAPLMTMVDELFRAKRTYPYKLHFDNLFRSENLLKTLKERGCQGTGTIRENRIPKSCPLSSKKIIEKKTRGFHESIIDKTNGTIYVRWVDNGVVTVASTCHGVEPISNVRRYSQETKKIIAVPRPNIVGKYNSYMGGVDLMDENIARHRIAIRGKKWWWCLFTWIVDASLQNAWQIHKKCGGTKTNLEFRREIVQTYLKRYGVPPKAPGRPSSKKESSSREPDAI